MRRLTYALLSAGWLAACGREGASPRADIDDSKKPAWLRETVEPTNLRVTSDPARARSGVIPVSGGTLAATGADGSLFVLQIPSGALLMPTRITMTPVTRVEGLPGSSRMVATVQLEPDGLQLYRAARLTIRPPRPVTETEAYGYAYAGSGSDAHLHPAVGDSTQAEFGLSHFSGYGILYIQPTDLALKVLSRATAEADRLAAAITGSLRQMQCSSYRGGGAIGEADSVKARLERECRNVSGDARLEDAVAKALEYYDFAVRPILLLALKDPAAYECALQAGIRFQKQLQLLGMPEKPEEEDEPGVAQDRELTRLRSEVRKRLQDEAALQAQARELYQKAVLARIRDRCREGDLTQLQQGLVLARAESFLGDSAAATGLLTEAFDLMDRCFQFEVDFESEINNGFPGGEYYYHVKAKLPYTAVEATQSDSAAEGGGDSARVAPLQFVQHIARGNPGRVTFGAPRQNVGDRIVTAFTTGELSSAGTRDGALQVRSLAPVANAVPDSAPALDCQGRRIRVPVPQADTLQIMLRIEAPTELTRLRSRFVPEGSVTEGQSWQRHFYAFRWENRYDPDRDLRDAVTQLLMQARSQGEALAIMSNPEFRRVQNERQPAEGGWLLLKLPRVRAAGVWRMDFEKASPPEEGLTLFEKGHIIVRHTPKL